MKFRKKPVVVEAVQWLGPETKLPFVQSEKSNSPYVGWEYYVVTIHGQNAYLAPGDWIITEMDGVHHYPCKPDIFDATYEAVTE